MASNFEEIIEIVNKYKWISAHPAINKCMTCNNAKLTICACTYNQTKNYPFLERAAFIYGPWSECRGKLTDGGRENHIPSLAELKEIHEQARYVFMGNRLALYKILLCFCDVSRWHMTCPVEICDRYERLGDYDAGLKAAFSLEEIEREYQNYLDEREKAKREREEQERLEREAKEKERLEREAEEKRIQEEFEKKRREREEKEAKLWDDWDFGDEDD